MSSTWNPIERLIGEHRALSVMFLRHQEALVERRWEEAGNLLETYRRELQHHMAFEEERLLPHCGGNGAARWPGEVYLAEHRRVERLLHQAIEHLAWACAKPIASVHVIALLEEERTLKRLLEHHHEREETALFVEFEGVGKFDPVRRC